MSHTRIGLCDTPLERSDDDCLGLERYARALADFAEECETPITIALQGDWGSGKTSLMNLIREQLSEKEYCTCVWFNTWQYSQFGLENQLAASLISFFINALPEGNTEAKFLEKKIDARKIATFLGRLTLALGSGMGGIPGALINTAGAAVSSAAQSDSKDEKLETDPAVYIADLKKKLTEIVEDITKQNTRRIIVFIDDLDRLPPAKAVELLEAFKLFLDIRGCVFFLACDYKVINQGLKAKFGEEIASNNEKNFFDKIIQLPFKMPVLQYEVEGYIGDLLKKIAIEHDESDIKKYHDLIEASIGFNPRGLKRAFNTLLLLKRVANMEGNSGSDSDDRMSVNQNEKARLLFAIICMQLAYEFFYKFVYKFSTEDIAPLFDKLMDMDGHREDKDINKLIKELNTEYEQERFQKFIEALFNAMQLKFDNQEEVLSKDEAQVFRDMLKLSQVTSTSEEIQDGQVDRIRSINNTVCKKLKLFLDEKYRSLSGNQNLEFKIRRHKNTSDMEIILEKPNKKLNWIGIWLGRTNKDHVPYYFSIEIGLFFDNKEKILKNLQSILKEERLMDKAHNPLEVKFGDNPRYNYISIYREEHNWIDMDTEALYQKIKSLVGEYFNVLPRI